MYRSGGRFVGFTRLVFLACWTLAISCPLEADEATRDYTALYGEIAVLQDNFQPPRKTGHDAMQPVTDAISGYFDFKQRLRERGLNYTVEYAPQFQWNLDGGDHGNDETNLIAQWSPIDPANTKRGTLMGWYQVSNTLGDVTTSEFQDEAGVISPLNGGDTFPAGSSQLWQMLAWEQWFGEERVRFGAGKLTTRTFLNLNRYAVSDREDFFSPMLVNNPVSPFAARNGMGAFVQIHLEEKGYITAMVREADGTGTDISFDTIDSGNWETAIEFALTLPDLVGMGEGNYRFTLYHTDAIGEGGSAQPAGESLALSFDQDVGERYGLLFRYAKAYEDFRAFEERLAIGMQIKAPLGFQYDRIGLAMWWGDPVDDAIETETGFEAFWKWQLAPWFELSSNLQYIPEPQARPDADDALFAGIRLRLDL